MGEISSPHVHFVQKEYSSHSSGNLVNSFGRITGQPSQLIYLSDTNSNGLMDVCVAQELIAYSIIRSSCK